MLADATVISLEQSLPFGTGTDHIFSPPKMQLAYRVLLAIRYF